MSKKTENNIDELKVYKKALEYAINDIRCDHCDLRTECLLDISFGKRGCHKNCKDTLSKYYLDLAQGDCK